MGKPEHTPQNATAVQWLDLTDSLLEQLRGRLSLAQPNSERQELVSSTLDGLYKNNGHHLPSLVSPQAKDAFLREFLSYGMIEEFLADPAVEDILINATETIYVHKTGEGLVRTNRRFETNRDVEVFAKKLIVLSGRAEMDPINDVELIGIRGRANIIQSPFGPQITITRSKPKPLTIFQLIETDMLSYELAAQLWLYIEGLRIRPANMIISGGPGTGKTTLLNALLSFIPPKERLVVIEDTLELNTDCLENCSRLESCRRIKMDALVKNALRMRPERILVGEVRGAEARDLMTTMNLGKYCMGTVHASSVRETILRLQNEPMNVPPMLVSLVDVFVILRKLNIEGRVMRVVGEVAETAGMEGETVLVSSVWAHPNQKGRGAVEPLPSSVYRDRLATEAGRTSMQIMEETARRAKVLQLMHESGRFPEIWDVTTFCQLYVSHPDEALRQLGTTAKKSLSKS